MRQKMILASLAVIVLFGLVGAAVATQAQVEVEAGQIYFVEQNQRIGISSGRVQIDIRDEDTGMAAVQGLKLLVSTYLPD